MRKMPTEEEVIYQPVVLLKQISVPVAVAEEEVEQIVFVPDLPVLRPGLVPGPELGIQDTKCEFLELCFRDRMVRN